jgi:hypothetical protein|nr:MAG TPA: Protein of unknown function DUF104 [Caudoviricetes sp.]
MLAAVKGYYDGKQIIVDENDRKSLNVGDELIITILSGLDSTRKETRAERRSRILDSKKYVNSGKMTTMEIDEYIKEQRSDERF